MANKLKYAKNELAEYKANLAAMSEAVSEKATDKTTDKMNKNKNNTNRRGNTNAVQADNGESEQPPFATAIALTNSEYAM